MQPIEIHELTEADAAACWRMRLDSLESDPAAFSGSVNEHLATDVRSFEDRLRHRPDGALGLGAFEGGELVGMVSFVRVQGEKQRHKGRISAIYVSASQRHRGTARALLAGLIEIVRRDPSIEQILVSVSASQGAACRLYRSFGFTVYGTEPAAMKIGTTYVDSHDMILRISDR